MEQKKCEICGKSFTPRESFHTKCNDCQYGSNNRKGSSFDRRTTEIDIPDDYLSYDYYDEEGYLDLQFISGYPEKLAKAFVSARQELTNTQLRRFYQNVMNIEKRLKQVGDFNVVLEDIKMLKAFVAEAKGKGKVPKVFYDFISKNVDLIDDEKKFTAFIKHFQAIVANFSYFNPNKK